MKLIQIQGTVLYEYCTVSCKTLAVHGALQGRKGPICGRATDAKTKGSPGAKECAMFDILQHCDGTVLCVDCPSQCSWCAGMFALLRMSCMPHIQDDAAIAGVCAGNWDRKEKRAMGFNIPHRTLAMHLMKGKQAYASQCTPVPTCRCATLAC